MTRFVRLLCCSPHTSGSDLLGRSLGPARMARGARGAFGVLALCSALGCSDEDGNDRPNQQLYEGADAGACPVEETMFPDAGWGHYVGDPIVDYPDPPPIGGPHHSCWLEWGVYDDELRDEKWLHNLEHGDIVYLYRCPDGCPDEVAALKELVTGREHALLTPYSELPRRFAAVAWGYRLVTNCFDPVLFQRFWTNHVNRGRESDPGPVPDVCK